ncbi:TIGR04283 family arsenosugar biosynthesis glycosyltransferase [Halocola ammonii]
MITSISVVYRFAAMQSKIKVSVIIPTLNEADFIGTLVEFLTTNADSRLEKVIVCDGGSVDGTAELARDAGAEVVENLEQSRAVQMNAGWKVAGGNVLYFVHADSLPPKTYLDDIEEELKKGSDLGCYRFLFNSRRPALRFNSFMTRFNALSFRGGDQTLFVKREVFEELNGYDESYEIMEEYDFLIRANKRFKFSIIPKDVKVSARKYEYNSYFRVNVANIVAFTMFRLNCSASSIKRVYFKMLRHPKDNNKFDQKEK